MITLGNILTIVKITCTLDCLFNDDVKYGVAWCVKCDRQIDDGLTHTETTISYPCEMLK